jgi:hypothetical protein
VSLDFELEKILLKAFHMPHAVYVSRRTVAILRILVEETRMLATESSLLGAHAMYEVSNVRHVLHDAKDAPETSLGSAALQARNAGVTCSDRNKDLPLRIVFARCMQR